MTPNIITITVDAQMADRTAAGSLEITHCHGHTVPTRIFKRLLNSYGPCQSHTEARLRTFLFALNHCLSDLKAGLFEDTTMFHLRVVTQSAPFATLLNENKAGRDPAQQTLVLEIRKLVARFGGMVAEVAS